MQVENLSKNGILFSATVYTLALFVLITMALQTSVSVAILTTDPASLSHFPFYTGLLSNIGIIFWTITATVCLFTSTIKSIDTQRRLFMGLIGSLTFLLMLDDQFLLHEEVFPRFLGLSGTTLYAIYAIFLCGILLKYRLLILKTNPLLLFLPLAFFSASVMAGPITGGLLTTSSLLLFEDGCKFLGILGWFVYFSTFCFGSLHKSNAAF